MNTFKTNTGKALMILSIGFLSACGTGTTTTTTEDPDTLAGNTAVPQIDEGFYDIPQPIEQVQLLQKAGATYDKSILNPLENASRYATTKSKALNLGVYGADLSYAAVFNQPQDVALYLAVSKKLSEELNINGAFYADIAKRLETSGNNKDSLLRVVSEVYLQSNASLKENDQSHLSALVVVGSFIEAMYVATQVAKNVKNKEAIYERISDFKSTVNRLVVLTATVHDNSAFTDVLADLKSLKAIYDESEEPKLSEKQIEKLSKQVKAIRINITNM